MAQFAITLTRAQVRAALIFAADGDIRHYLNGVCLEVGECGDTRLIATCGSQLAVLAVGDHPAATPGEYIIPRDVLKAIKRAGRKVPAEISLQIDGARVIVASGDEILSGGQIIDGKFPDWQRVCPEPERMSGEAGSFDARYLANIRTALLELGDRHGVYNLLQNGPAMSALTIAPDHGLMVVTMPVRADGRATSRDRARFMPRRPVFAAVVETAAGGQAYPFDPAQDVTDKRPAAGGDATPSGEAGTAQASGDRPRLQTEQVTRNGQTVYLLASVPAWARREGNPTAYALTYGSLGVAEARAAKLRAAGVAAQVCGRGPYQIAIDPSGEVSAAACPTLIPGRWIPGGVENAERIGIDSAIGAEVWLVASTRQAGACAVIAYSGKRGKHDAHYTMPDRATAQRWADDYITKHQAHARRAAERRAEKSAARQAGHQLRTGDVLRSSWGYDQTNIDYYDVTREIGARMVEIRAISGRRETTGYYAGESVPAPGHYTGEPMRKVVGNDGRSVRIASYASAFKIEPRDVAGVKVWPVDNWTAYA